MSLLADPIEAVMDLGKEKKVKNKCQGLRQATCKVILPELPKFNLENATVG